VHDEWGVRGNFGCFFREEFHLVKLSVYYNIPESSECRLNFVDGFTFYEFIYWYLFFLVASFFLFCLMRFFHGIIFSVFFQGFVV